MKVRREGKNKREGAREINSVVTKGGTLGTEGAKGNYKGEELLFDIDGKERKQQLILFCDTFLLQST